MKERLFVTPQNTTAEAPTRVRMKLGLTQKEFAMLVGCSKATVERWEASKGTITGPICLLLKMLDKYPEYVQNARVPKKSAPIRLWYMHNETVCNILDVNDMKRDVHINYYSDNIMFRAFGIEEHPDYEMYVEFLESRCFPESRDKMKLILKDLDLPFYDPFMIIE